MCYCRLVKDFSPIASIVIVEKRSLHYLLFGLHYLFYPQPSKEKHGFVLARSTFTPISTASLWGLPALPTPQRRLMTPWRFSKVFAPISKTLSLRPSRL